MSSTRWWHALADALALEGFASCRTSACCPSPPALHGPALHGREELVKGLLDPQVLLDLPTLQHVGHGVHMASTHWARRAQGVPVWVGPRQLCKQ